MDRRLFGIAPRLHPIPPSLFRAALIGDSLAGPATSTASPEVLRRSLGRPATIGPFKTWHAVCSVCGMKILQDALIAIAVALTLAIVADGVMWTVSAAPTTPDMYELMAP